MRGFVMSRLEERRRIFVEAARECAWAGGSLYSQAWRRMRLKRGWIVAELGGNISDLAHVEGVGAQSMVRWLQHNDRDLWLALKDAAHPSTLSNLKRLERLIAIRDGRAKGQPSSEIARSLGISKSRMNAWLKLWAPDGIEMAIYDETDYEEAA